MSHEAEPRVMRTLFVPVPLDTELREVAIRTGRTGSDLIRGAISDMLSSLRGTGRAASEGWKFWNKGRYGPADEQTLRDFSRRLSLYSCEKGMASCVMEQQWKEIDRLRARVAELERPMAG